MLNTVKLSLQSNVVQGEGNIVSEMDGEKVMLSIHNGKYYNLGEVGGNIWVMLKSPILVSELIELLLSEYNVDYSKCKAQVMSFLELLTREGLIQIKEAKEK
ncbi:lasso peptide biosynthesis PqqD family chaperone [Mesobacillus foraminis]|uniref:Coenzyme PQQ synthesis protein D (PqqD) n=1 Tax=Mesobacillus foraminis TaxID=279826 RepID=A0A4R2B5Y0_9BACI|nr:lasso peptide biosynthesis PqqD family chaperone [Mesobacillus foraminis]TCN22178.1 coenzyme PQQ synthesis protein D (PqqD) [Mesobacillus foraminis]